jgi:hypothetical protein
MEATPPPVTVFDMYEGTGVKEIIELGYWKVL